MIQLLIVDPDARVRQGLRMRLGLEPDLAVVGEAGDVPRAIALVNLLCPDVVLMDVELPGMDGMAAVRELHHCAAAPAQVLLLTMRDDRCTRERAVTCGASALVSKQESVTSLLAAIRAAAGRNRQPDPVDASPIGLRPGPPNGGTGLG